jgi:hypothetical protein
MSAEGMEQFRFLTLPTSEVGGDVLRAILALFAESYRDANTAYLQKSLKTLAYVTVAWEGETPAGFGFAETRRIDLPRLPAQVVALGGICCVSPPYRRRHLFGQLEARSLRAGEVQPEGRVLSAGRMAHPASYRGMNRNPSAVPQRGVRLTRWQQEVGQAITEAYGSPGFDPETFVVRGSGEPVGYPVIEIEASDEEWELFAPVNRAAGDSLVGIAWNPDAPPGWFDE